MTKRDLEAYRRRLREMAGRLTGEVTELRGEALQPTGEAASASASDAETVHGAGEEEAALAMLGIEEHSLEEVAAALDRIDRGTFGQCAGCGRPISKARLDVLPSARHCIRCARRQEAGPAQ